MKKLLLLVALVGLAAIAHLAISAEPALELASLESRAAAPDVDWKALEPRLVGDLQALLRLDTVRGRERVAAELVRDVLAQEGVQARLIDVEGAPDRAALVAELPGRVAEGGLVLAGHLDVVESEPKEWSHAPLSGDLADGRVWGRGAIDMKGMAIMELHAFLAVKRAGVALEHPLMLLLTPDEESGSTHGMQEFLKNHGDLLAAYTDVVEEGGVGTRDVAVKGATVFNLQCAEKGVLWVKAIASGPSGHGSTPPARYATKDLLAFVSDVQALESGITLTDTTAGFFRQLASVSPLPDSFVLARARHPLARALLGGSVNRSRHLQAMTSNTRTLTGLSSPAAGPNVVPSRAEAVLDVRLLPGVAPDAYLERLKATGAPRDVTLEVIHAHAASTSPTDAALFRTLGAVAARAVPGAVVAPFMSPGGTDCTFLRGAGKRCYGLIPVVLSATDLDGIHGKDENLSVDNLVLGTRILYETVFALNR